MLNAELGMLNAELGMLNAEWGMLNAEWGMLNAEWGMLNAEWGRSPASHCDIHHSAFIIPNYIKVSPVPASFSCRPGCWGCSNWPSGSALSFSSSCLGVAVAGAWVAPCRGLRQRHSFLPHRR